jgi:anion-transporting  ArsA/GET3 family ATPase
MAVEVAKAAPIEARRFHFITGKGGVGKTTVTAALALAFARRNKRVLVAMCGAQERLSSLLGTPSIGHDVMQVRPNIWATKIEPERAMEEYGELVIKVKTVARLVFDNKYTNAFFRAVPGLFEWAMLGKAWWHTTELDKAKRPKYDVVLFDAPSTGHGLNMLRVPKVILDIVPPGILRQDAEKAWDLFCDAERCGVLAVTLPEDMPVTETIELTSTLTGELGLPVQRLIVNGRLSPLFTSEERRNLVSDSELFAIARDVSGGRSVAQLQPGVAALAAAARRAAREEIQERNIIRLQQECGLPMTVLPFLIEGAGAPGSVESLSQIL